MHRSNFRREKKYNLAIAGSPLGRRNDVQPRSKGLNIMTDNCFDLMQHTGKRAKINRTR